MCPAKQDGQLCKPLLFQTTPGRSPNEALQWEGQKGQTQLCSETSSPGCRSGLMLERKHLGLHSCSCATCCRHSESHGNPAQIPLRQKAPLLCVRLARLVCHVFHSWLFSAVCSFTVQNVGLGRLWAPCAFPSPLIATALMKAFCGTHSRCGYSARDLLQFGFLHSVRCSVFPVSGRESTA